MRRECLERFPRHPRQSKALVSDPGIHHGRYVAHVPWCTSGSLVMHVGIANPRWREKRSQHSWRMRNPQFDVSDKSPMRLISFIWIGDRCRLWKILVLRISMQTQATVSRIPELPANQYSSLTFPTMFFHIEVSSSMNIFILVFHEISKQGHCIGREVTGLVSPVYGHAYSMVNSLRDVDVI